MQMELISNTHIPDGLLAAMTLLSEKPRQGVPSRKSALHPGIDERNCTAVLGLRFGWSGIVSGTVVAPNNETKSTCYKPGIIGRAAAKALSWLSLDGGGYLLGISGGVAGGLAAVDGTRAFVSDTHGNVGMMTTIAVSGGSVIGASASGGLSIGASNFSSLSGYAGWSGQGTISGGVGLGGSASLSANTSGASYTLTAGGGFGASASGGLSYSWVSPLCK
jgi:hypothetical protein